MMSLRRVVLGLVMWTVLAETRAQADFVVVPNNLAGTEAIGDNGFPFNIGSFGLDSQRYQQVYAASQFAALGGPQFITQIAFRPGAFGSAFASTLPDIQIDLSTTPRAVDDLSTTFADNVGPDDTVVYGRGPLSLSSAFVGPANGPKAFDIVINLTTPFLYNPAAGNLLLDVRNFADGQTTLFDATSALGDPVARTYTNEMGGVNFPTSFPDSTGLVTRFTAVPAPASLVLLGTGLLGILGAGWLRRGRARAAGAG